MNFTTPDWTKKIQQPQVIVVGLVVLMILWMTTSAVVSAVNHRLVGKLEVESTVTRINFTTYGFVDPVEDIILPDVSGPAQPAHASGSRAAKNERVLQVTYEKTENNISREEDKYFYAPIAGLISYDIDGYEEVTDPDEIAKLDLKALYEKELSRKPGEAEKNARAGQAYAKVVDNLASSNLVLSYYPDHNDIFKEVGDVFRIRFPDFEATGIGTVEDIVSLDADRSLAVVRLSPMSDAFLQTRFVKCEPYRVEPALIPLDRNVLVYREDYPGVYTLSNRVVTWTRVSIEEEAGAQVKIKALPVGTVIITSPNRVSPGDYLS